MQIDILLNKLAKPAQRAIQNAGIKTLEQLCEYSEKEFSQLHGIGKNAIDITNQILSEYGLTFASKH
jgi:DNA-directed RNA polymerase alpha subunit